MKNLKKTLITSAIVLLAVIILMAIVPPDIEFYFFDADVNGYTWGWWALLPPIIAISLALITKEVYPSLLVGVVSGAIIYSELDIRFSFTNSSLVLTSLVSPMESSTEL